MLEGRVRVSRVVSVSSVGSVTRVIRISVRVSVGVRG